MMDRPGSPQNSSGQGGVELNIDELIIRGVAPGNRQRILQEVQEELTRLLRENGLPAPAGLSAGPPVAAPRPQAARGDSFARQIAQSIFQGLATSG